MGVLQRTGVEDKVVVTQDQSIGQSVRGPRWAQGGGEGLTEAFCDGFGGGPREHDDKANAAGFRGLRHHALQELLRRAFT